MEDKAETQRTLAALDAVPAEGGDTPPRAATDSMAWVRYRKENRPTDIGNRNT